MFKVGQRVFTTAHGWGKIIHEGDGRGTTEKYPFIVEFENGDAKYVSREGSMYLSGSLRSVFFKEIPIPPDALEPPWEPDFQPGDVVEILRNENKYGYSPYFYEVLSCTKQGVLIKNSGDNKPVNFLRDKWNFRKVGHV